MGIQPATDCFRHPGEHRECALDLPIEIAGLMEQQIGRGERRNAATTTAWIRSGSLATGKLASAWRAWRDTAASSKSAGRGSRLSAR